MIPVLTIPQLVDVVFILGAFVLVWACLARQRKPQSKIGQFDLGDVITGDNGRVSGTNMRLLGTWYASTWLVLHLAITNNEIAEFVYLGYLGAWVTYGLGNKYLSRDQVTTTTTTPEGSTKTTASSDKVAPIVVPMPIPASSPVAVMQGADAAAVRAETAKIETATDTIKETLK